MQCYICLCSIMTIKPNKSRSYIYICEIIVENNRKKFRSPTPILRGGLPTELRFACHLTQFRRMRYFKASSICPELRILLLYEAGTGASAGKAQVVPTAAGSKSPAARCRCAKAVFRV